MRAFDLLFIYLFVKYVVMFIFEMSENAGYVKQVNPVSLHTLNYNTTVLMYHRDSHIVNKATFN